MSSKNQQNINAFVSELFNGLDTRQVEVLKGRYGLNGDKLETLQTIGNRYGITRERVRQIEALALHTLKSAASHPYVKTLADAAVTQLKRVGGIQAENDFLAALHTAITERGTLTSFLNPAKFLLELSGKVSCHRDHYGNWHTFWYLAESDKKRAHGFIEKVSAELASQRKNATQAKPFDAVFSDVARAMKIAPEAGKSYLAASKKFMTSPFGDFGLADWSDINPKTARDWAYVILKREKRPLHFSELAKIIGTHRTGKNTNLQTIHNELIKDNRFVLVGRGLYGLREHGYIPGTAKEIISHLLKQNGPLHSHEVVKLVKSQRILKEGTVLINLQNKKHFVCMPDGRYSIREA
jgi:hypothetical protein